MDKMIKHFDSHGISIIRGHLSFPPPKKCGRFTNYRRGSFSWDYIYQLAMITINHLITSGNIGPPRMQIFPLKESEQLVFMCCRVHLSHIPLG